MAAEFTAMIICLGLSWFCLTKVITKKGWQRVLWLILGILFCVSWIGNSFVFFGSVGWLIGIIIIAIFGVKYAKNQKSKV